MLISSEYNSYFQMKVGEIKEYVLSDWINRNDIRKVGCKNSPGHWGHVVLQKKIKKMIFNSIRLILVVQVFVLKFLSK